MSSLSSVFITREVFEESIELLEKNFKVISNQNDILLNNFIQCPHYPQYL